VQLLTRAHSQLWARKAAARPPGNEAETRTDDAPGLADSCDPEAVSAARQAATQAKGIMRVMQIGGKATPTAVLPWLRLRASAVSRLQSAEEVRMLLLLRQLTFHTNDDA